MKAIHIKTSFCEGELPMCASKFWGNPDLPKSFDFPTYKDAEGEESHYDFLCQIRCSELTAYDPEGQLPHSGMLYFFAQIGYYLGDIYFCEPMPSGLWPRDGVRVLYYPKEDWENFETLILLDDDEEEVALREQKIEFVCDDATAKAEGKAGTGAMSGMGAGAGVDAGAEVGASAENFGGHKLLGFPDYLSDEIDPSQYSLLLQVDSCDLDDGVELNFMDCGMLYFLWPTKDVGRTFKNVRGFLASS